MGTVGSDKNKRPTWLYPKVVGFNPTERWGHSACCFDGVVYVFGGCCGGSHFSDVLALNLETMRWAPLVITGDPPGTRDSHTAVVVGKSMVVFGGTNGSRKVNEVHVLDLRSGEWRKPSCTGEAPSARESHTATVVGGGERMVVFGGSGVKYLDDVHVLDLRSMEWSAPEVSGRSPAARDSHTAVGVGNKVVVYGGDRGDRYHGEVDVLDVDTMTWSTLAVQGPSPGVRAGHSAVGIGTKVYIIGGVGDKHYYGDVWVLDLNTCSWSQLDTAGHQPQGRFSHTAVVANSDIVIYGGCGQDERPLNELVVLRLGSEYNSMSKIFGSHWSQYKHKLNKSPKVLHDAKRGPSSRCNEVEPVPKLLTDDSHSKRKKVGDSKTVEMKSEPDEHSLSLSQGSSPSNSDHEQNTRKRTSPLCEPSRSSSWNNNTNYTQHCNYLAPDNRAEVRCNIQGNGSLPMPQLRRHDIQIQTLPPLIGAEVHGTVDGSFDSGYLMTANVNGQLFRGVLFSPGPDCIVPRPVLHPRCPTIPIIGQPQVSGPGHAVPIHARSHKQNVRYTHVESGRIVCEAKRNVVDKIQHSKLGEDLQGVVLTLGGPGVCD